MNMTQTLNNSFGSRTRKHLRIGDGLRQITLDLDQTIIGSKVLRELAAFVAWQASPPATDDLLISHRLKLLSRLNELRKDDYDEDFLAPTEHAYTSALNFMLAAFESLEYALPTPFYVPDGEGGIRMEWINGTRELGLICPASESREPYLYHEDGNEYGIDEQLTDSVLNERLYWLISE